MVLSRSKQEVQAHRTTLGIIYRKIVKQLVDLCKGRISVRDGEWFYKLLLKRAIINVPQDVFEVRHKLRSAWWIEENDIQQEIFYYTYKFNLTSNSNLLFTLGRNLRDYLIFREQVFNRQCEWEKEYLWDNYKNTEFTRQIGLSMVFQINPLDACDLSLFDRYLVYLSCILKLPRYKLTKILLSKAKQVNRFQLALKERVEDYYD